MVSIKHVDQDVFLQHTFPVPSGPPQNFTILVTSRNITLFWSPPLLSQRNGDIISYNLSCNISGATSSVRRNITSIEIPVEPFTSYSCAVSAATVVGDGPATAVISGVTDEESEHILQCIIT